jgi:xanthosine utilization system XapX-like protein
MIAAWSSPLSLPVFRLISFGYVGVNHGKQWVFRLCLIALFCPGIAQAQSSPTITKAFSAASVPLNASATLTFTITNPNPATDLTNVSFNDNLPAGLIIANPDSLVLDPVQGACDPTGTTGTITPQTNSINLIGGQIPASATCTFSVDVLAISAGTQVNTTDPITSTEGGTGGTATATLDVVVPDLTITMSHSGNFLRPQTGATYTITVSNSGADTSALITVDINLPAGVTATALGGPNWNCTLSPLQCTRGDTLFAGTSFEDITLTVDVANSAPASFTASATVSGGGESNTANDTASDPTQTTAALVLAAQTTSASVTAGGTANTTLNVTTNGSGLGAITFACSGLPSGATCSFNPSSVTTTSQVTMSIATTAKSVVFSPQLRWPIMPYAALLGLLGIMATVFSRQTRKFKLRFAAGMAVAALLALAGCGVSMKTPAPPHNPGTPAGNFAVTVTASSASGGATATSIVNLTVQ